MQARELMTPEVISVGPDEPTQKVAQVLLEHGISAVPVVEADGVPVGMVSEGDLIGRSEQDRVARREWWLALFTGRQRLEELQPKLVAPGRTARDVMSAPVITVTEDTDASEIARLLASYHIKRVPVLRDGHLVGIVSRADLLRAVATTHAATASPEQKKPRGFLLSLFGEYHRPAWETVPVHAQAEAKPKPDEAKLRAEDFRHIVEDHQHDEAHQRDAARQAATKQRQQRAKEMIDQHVSDPAWRQLLHRAREAAEAGQQEALLLQFPSQLCVDGGRAINVAEPDWPMSLRGEAAELYLRWERDLKPRGFTLTARVVDFPDGKPGDIGMFLGW